MEEIASPEEKVIFLMDLAFQKGSLDEEKVGERFRAYAKVLTGAYEACGNITDRANEVTEDELKMGQTPMPVI